MTIKQLKVIISGGGTGGHIFPAIAIANAIKARHPNADILFVGAENRMEMKRVPAAGYPIIGLEVMGLYRRRLVKNILVLWKLYKSLIKAREIIKTFQPHIAIGVGGYASGPTLNAAARSGIPILVQEQNSYAGITNKLLARKATKICVAYEGMDAFFQKNKIVITGNPCRHDLLATDITREECFANFDLDPSKKTILIVGGSLGSKTINDSISSNIDQIIASGLQIIWQCGEYYIHELSVKLSYKEIEPSVRLYDFISRMDMAYKIADLVVSRAGASSISELSLLAKPVLLVPSPNVAEDHQTKNAMALVNKNAAILIADKDATRDLVDTALKTIADEPLMKSLSENIAKLAYHDSANKIVDEVEKIIASRSNMQR